MLENLLKSKQCFKLVCGAGNEDLKEIEKLVILYAKAGCRFFDLSASDKVVEVAKNALTKIGINDASLCVSVGIKDDPHVNKALINYDRCKSCGLCDEVCPQKAIRHAVVTKSKCIGCSKCWDICPENAISFVSEEKVLQEILPPIIAKGVDCIEFHAIGTDENEISEKWNYINENFDGMLSICTSRGKLSDESLVRRVKNLIKDREPYTTIIQADGFPMSGGKNDYKTTLQAVATAEVIQNANLPVYLMLSGGTNSKTSELAKMCGIDAHGVAVGSYARSIVKQFIEHDDFLTNEELFNSALEIVNPLVNSVKATL